ncbi:MAG TPA: DNA-formamidopyrimidine glycosylase family protein [Acidimicrobiia bacterium]|jgi:DNA-formamidopyrimidine glycosylase|nr:DNA-formamidopyrimidine glycosylase family protein [Acidimicrobiia bacterium]
MPEGHTLHRIARRHDGLFSGAAVRASSPQGRFTEGAALLDGRHLEVVVAHGKHLFYHWRDAPALYVHLGLVGKFRTWSRRDPPPPTSGTRLVLFNDDATAYLAGPMSCRLLEPGEADTILGGLGPDPIASRRGRRTFAERLGRKRVPIAAALLDQSVIAGIGNVYRAELLFLLGVHPETPANRLDPETVDALWDATVDELRRGVELGRIVTVRPREIGARSRAQLSRDEAVYVYKRDGLPCRRCGTEIRTADIGARRTWWCPSCQTR